MASAAATASSATIVVAPSTSYARFAGLAAILAGLVGFLYSVAFVVLKNNTLSALFLLIVGLLTTAVVVALYERLKIIDGSFALWALLLGLAGAIGSVVHGGYDLANALHPPTQGFPDIPNVADPRGLLTFGIAGLSLWVVAWLMRRGTEFPKYLGYVGYLGAALLILLYLARLIVLDANSLAIVIPALLAGFIVNPVFYVWTGLKLWSTGK
ncbi:MAG TPA: hypothetical protein VGL99_22010 [Chloroflexota bacterium]|jgi:hypothetical protein